MAIDLRKRIIRLAFLRPDLRDDLLPLVKQARSKNVLYPTDNPKPGNWVWVGGGLNPRQDKQRIHRVSPNKRTIWTDPDPSLVLSEYQKYTWRPKDNMYRLAGGIGTPDLFLGLLIS